MRPSTVQRLTATDDVATAWSITAMHREVVGHVPAGSSMPTDHGRAVRVPPARDEVSPGFQQEIEDAAPLYGICRPAQGQPFADPAQVDRPCEPCATDLRHRHDPRRQISLDGYRLDGRPCVAEAIEVGHDSRVEPASR